MLSTSLSANDVYCLAQKGFDTGNFVLGNSIYYCAFIESLGTKPFTSPGIELKQATEISHDAWAKALQRMQLAADKLNGESIIAIDCYTRLRRGFLEYLAIGSLVSSSAGSSYTPFLTSMNGQEFYTYLDAGYAPLKFALSNIVYQPKFKK